MLRDEPDFVGRALAAHLDTMFEQGPAALAHWLLRVFMMLTLAPPPTDLDELLDAMLLPVLPLTGSKRRARGRTARGGGVGRPG
ncbi:hypothetical protein [Actinomadura fibrosa]|uniref:Uncharacterized protein n=1 Tax=Actinomadura fibrosa TaxID=111802 RepID=A0ABW2XTR4_9ACTN|nr:hypothetical protein [Actinomadura fibrosa]